MPAALSQSEQSQPLLASLEAGLEKFLDVLGEIQQVEVPSVLRLRPEEAGFALTFPYESAVGVFLLADRGDILPAWHQNPGLAGNSRLELLRRGLMTLFAPNETVPEMPAGFFTSAQSFCGRVAELEQVLAALQALPEVHTRAFLIRRFDGQTGLAWMTAPVTDIETLRQHAWQEAPDEDLGQTLKPLRALEGNYRTAYQTLRPTERQTLPQEAFPAESQGTFPTASQTDPQTESRASVPAEPQTSLTTEFQSSSQLPLQDTTLSVETPETPETPEISTVEVESGETSPSESTASTETSTPEAVSALQTGTSDLQADSPEESEHEPTSAETSVGEPLASPLTEPLAATEYMTDVPASLVASPVVPSIEKSLLEVVPESETALVEDYVETVEVPGGISVATTYRPEDLLIERLYTTVDLDDLPKESACKATIECGASDYGTTAETASASIAQVLPLLEPLKTSLSAITEAAALAPSVSEPVDLEPATLESSVSEPVISEPAASESRVLGPAVAESAVAEPAVSESATVEPASEELTTADPTTTKATTPGPAPTPTVESALQSPETEVEPQTAVAAAPTATPSAPVDFSAERILDIPVTFSARLTRRTLPIRQILSLKQGDILQLGHPEELPLGMYIDGCRIGDATLVEYDGCLGVQALSCSLKKATPSGK